MSDDPKMDIEQPTPKTALVDKAPAASSAASGSPAFDNDPSADLSTRDSVKVRIYYAGMLFVMVLLSMIVSMADWTQWLIKWFSGFDGCQKDADPTLCIQFSFAFRASLAMVLLFSLIAFLLLASKMFKSYKAFDSVVHAEFFYIKVLLLIAITIGCFFIPQASIQSYGEFCRWVAPLFIVLQTLLLIDFAFSWNLTWVAREWFAAILLASLVLYGGAITQIVLMYKWFAGDGCGVNIFFITLTLISLVVYSVLGLLGDKPRGLLPSAVVAFYTSFQNFNALVGSADSCNTVWDSGSWWQVILSVVLCGMSIAYTASSAAAAPNAISLTEDDDDTSKATAPAYFHAIMALAAIYCAMVVTSWQVDTSDHIQGLAGSAKRTMWMKIIAEWLTIAAYTWSTIAPRILSDRVFE